MQRIRKDSETLSNPGVNTVSSRVRRDPGDRYRNDNFPNDPAGSVRSVPNQAVIIKNNSLINIVFLSFLFLENENLPSSSIY